MKYIKFNQNPQGDCNKLYYYKYPKCNIIVEKKIVQVTLE